MALRNLNASEKIISATLDRDTTCASNKIQKERRQQRELEGINYPDEFALESVRERLDAYDLSTMPDKQALADVMIMLRLRVSKTFLECLGLWRKMKNELSGSLHAMCS